MSLSLDIEDHAALLDYLRATDRIASRESPRFETLAGGVSNRTVLVERASGESWVIKQALEKLRTKAEWHSDTSRVHREALGIRWLSKLAPPGTIMPLVFEDFEHHLIAMQAVPKPHDNWKTMLLAGNVCEPHIQQFARMIASIHVESAKRKNELEQEFQDTSFFESLRIEPYYLYTAEQVPAAAKLIHRLVEESRRHKATLVHGDFSPKNILIHQDRMVLLDHEVIHFGDPTFDLGFSLTHLLSKGLHLATPGVPAMRHHAQNFRRAALSYWQHYESSAPELALAGGFQEFVVLHTLACLLARVCGRSPLEYLDSSEQFRQRRATIDLIQPPPKRVAELINVFFEQL